MNNNINIAEILRDCPKGTKLYSSIYGNVILDRVLEHAEYPIAINDKNSCQKLLSKEGLYLNDYPDAECQLFPSREMRDWRKFFKSGDVVVSKDGTKAGVFDKWNNDKYTSFLTSFSIYKDGTVHKSQIHSTNKYHKADEGQRAFFIMQAERILKGKYNPETLQVEPVKIEPVKVKCPFKPFDKVLVRNYDTDEWLPGFFYRFEKDWNHPYHIMNLHHLTDYAYLYCIPYEGNEHLLGTTDPYKEE